LSSGGLVVSTLLWSCAAGPIPTGELGNGQFSYACSEGTVDVGCSGVSAAGDGGLGEPITGSTTTLPKLIAVGSRFTVDYTSLVNGGTNSVQGASSYTVAPASTRLAEPSSDALLATRAGYLALLAMSPTTEGVEDFVFVQFADIASITASRAEVTEAAGATDTLFVTAQDDGMNSLAGRLACAWTVTAGADNVVIEGPSDGASVKIDAVADGDATVSVVCSGHSARVAVHVAGGVAVGDGGAEGGIEGGEAGTTDSSADAGNDGGSHG
jgi:hypothetical protein